MVRTLCLLSKLQRYKSCPIVQLYSYFSQFKVAVFSLLTTHYSRLTSALFSTLYSFLLFTNISSSISFIRFSKISRVNSLSYFSLPAFPIRWRNSGSLISNSSFSARAKESFCGTRKPVFPSSTTSGMHSLLHHTEEYFISSDSVFIICLTLQIISYTLPSKLNKSACDVQTFN